MERIVLPTVANRLKALSFEELDNLARAIGGLETHPGWSVLQGLVEGELVDLDGRLDRGDVPLDQATYAFLHGRRGALRFLRDAVSTVLVKHRERKAELERQPEAALNGR